MNESSPTVYLHIGAPKTGSTLLQKFFFEHQTALLERGFYYPDISLRGYGHHDLAFLLSGGYPDWATPQDRPLSDLTAQTKALIASTNSNILISSENFYLFPAPHAVHAWFLETGLSATHEIKIVAYVRRQDLAIESWYNQTIKAQGYTHTFDECFHEFQELWDYQKQLALWSDTFGLGALIVRPYEDGQFHGGNIVADFLASIGCDPLDERVPTERINSGLNRDILEFQRLTNSLPLTIQEKRTFHRSLIALTARTARTGLFDETSLLDDAARKRILEGYAAGNAAVASLYLDREQLFFEEPIDRTPEPDVPVGLTLEKLVYIMGWLMTQNVKSEVPHATE